MQEALTRLQLRADQLTQRLEDMEHTTDVLLRLAEDNTVRLERSLKVQGTGLNAIMSLGQRVLRLEQALYGDVAPTERPPPPDASQ